MPHKNNTSKRLESTKEYIDKLQENNSKILVVRVDLGYKKPYSDDITLDDANKDLNRMYTNMRSKPKIFKEQIGYVIKREYTEDKGVHIHAMLLFNGQQIQKDVYKGDEIGKYWEKITKNKGSFHNCNRNEYKQKGVGMLDYKDSEKRKILDDNVISYLCKGAQGIKPITQSKRTKAFTRGTLPKSKENIGRPRKKHDGV